MRQQLRYIFERSERQLADFTDHLQSYLKLNVNNMSESGEYTKLKKKLKRKAEETEKKLSSKKCKLLQGEKKSSIGNGLEDQGKLTEKNSTEYPSECKALHTSKKTKKKKKVKSMESEDSVENDQKGNTDKKCTKKVKKMKVKEDKNTLKDNVKSTVKSENIQESDSVKDIVDIKEKKREKRRQKKAAKLKQKEREKARAKGEEGESGVGRDQALQYLRKWKTQKEEWNFQKVRQVWLLQHMYSSKLVSDEDFATLLEYLEGLKGKGRSETTDKAESIVQKTEDLEDAEKEKEHVITESERARQVIQLLS